MKTLLKEYIKHIVEETVKEQLFRKTKPKSMFANYQSGGGGGGGGGGLDEQDDSSDSSDSGDSDSGDM